MPRRDKPDANRAEIVRDLRNLGYQVEIIGWPTDILVGAEGHNFLFEIKNRGSGLWQSQKQRNWWLQQWKGHRDVIFSTEDAIQAIEARISQF